MRLSGTQARSISSSRGLGNTLWDLAGNRPSLDLRFAESKSLVDATTGTNLVDFTRASSGTYVGSDGLIKTATTNHSLYSEEFDQSYWVKPSSGAIVTPNNAIAPDGSLTADLISNVGQVVSLLEANITVTASSTNDYYVTIYAKKSTASHFTLNCYYLGNAEDNVNFNFDTGVVSNLPYPNDYIFENVGNDWYRCGYRISRDSTGTKTNIRFRFWESGRNVESGNTYFWGAQLEQSSTVGEYVKTTSTINSAPRFDHDSITGECLGLLVEEQRQNLLLRSEDFSTTWTPTNTTVSTNQIAAPDGAITADKIVETATNAAHNISQDTASQSAGTYAFSIFAKAAERNVIQFVSTGVLGGFRANFDLANGVLGSVDTQLTASIIPFPNGWYRCVVTATSTTAGVLRAQWNIVTSPTSARVESYLGDTSKGLYLWGAQLEEGSFPTSYIPTTTSAVTRAADVASISGSNFSSWYRQDEGTAYVDADGLGTLVPSSDFQSLAIFSNGANDTRIELGYVTSNQAYFNIRNGGVQSVALVLFTNSARRCMAGAWSSASAAYAVNGGSTNEDDSVVVPSVNKLDIGGANGASIKEFHGTIRRLTYWPTRLPNETLQGITQQ